MNIGLDDPLMVPVGQRLIGQTLDQTSDWIKVFKDGRAIE